MCYTHNGEEPVPGCIGRGISGANYCADRPPTKLLYRGSNPADPLGVCEGDCDGDENCEGDLICFQRDGSEPVPGCNGMGARGGDYCVGSTFSPTWIPTLSPSISFTAKPTMSPTDEVINGSSNDDGFYHYLTHH